MKINTFLIFIILSVLTIISLFITSRYIITIDVLYNSLSDQLIKEQFLKFIDSQEKFEWIKYLFAPIIILFRSFLVSSCLSMGVFFYNTEIDVAFKKIFRITLIGELVFIIAEYTKVSYFLLKKSSYLLEDIQKFYPLSAINITGYDGLNSWWVYPLQILNLFELTYWVVLAFLIGKEIKKNTDKGFSIVATSYGIGLLIWVIVIMFLTINLS